MEISGIGWVSRFPTSKALSVLDVAFRNKAEGFVAALRDAGASVKISATVRPKERAYLMHYSYRIARQGLDPRTVPSLASVPIQWVHSKNGAFDKVASQNAAETMVQAFGIVSKPALNSRHTSGKAVDMTISWSGVLRVKKQNGQSIDIASTPRNGQNHALHLVALTYGVKKLISDPPHWSLDGH